jgi:GNAT superfamily N-acetyltransferase
MVSLRAATLADVERIAVVWHGAWRDAHVGHVPDALLPERTLDNFRERTLSRIPVTTVAVRDGQVIGFAMVSDDELEQLFVAAEARGTGASVRLLEHSETLIARHSRSAWLGVVAGNARARHFYERHGWHDAGPIAYRAELACGGTVIVTSRRYEKRVP